MNKNLSAEQDSKTARQRQTYENKKTKASKTICHSIAALESLLASTLFISVAS